MEEFNESAAGGAPIEQIHEVDVFQKIKEQVRRRIEDIWSNPKNPSPKSQPERERVINELATEQANRENAQRAR